MSNKPPHTNSLTAAMTTSILHSRLLYILNHYLNADVKLDEKFRPCFKPRHTTILTLIVLSVFHFVLLATIFMTPFIASRVYSSRLIPGFPCPFSDYLQTNGCTGPKDCLYPRAGSCIEFVECRWTSPPSDHKPVSDAVIMRCAPSDPRLEWNDLRKRCDYPGTKGTCSYSAPSSVNGRLLGQVAGEIEVGGKIIKDTWTEDNSGEWNGIGIDGRITTHGALLKYLWDETSKRWL
jgi:hypothetical protein